MFNYKVTIGSNTYEQAEQSSNPRSVLHKMSVICPLQTSFLICKMGKYLLLSLTETLMELGV